MPMKSMHLARDFTQMALWSYCIPLAKIDTNRNQELSMMAYLELLGVESDGQISLCVQLTLMGSHRCFKVNNVQMNFKSMPHPYIYPSVPVLV